MKQKYYYLFFLLFLSFFGFSQTLDQSNTSYGGAQTIENPSYPHLSQSFTNGLTGSLSRITIDVQSHIVLNTIGGDFELTIYQGDGFAGTVLLTHSFSVTDDFSGELNIDFTPIAVTSGTINTFKIAPATGSTGRLNLSMNEDLYSGGILYNGNFGPSTSWDLLFKTFVDIPIPATHLNFDGINNYIQLPNESSFDFTNQMTVEFWMNSNVNPEQWDALVVKGDDSWRVALTATGTIAFAGTNAFSDFYSTTSVTDGNWHHIAATYDGANANIYIDGVLENQLAGTANINNSTYNVAIGENLQMTGRYYNGNMEEVRIWNIVRTATQINASKNCELQGNETGLVAYYKFNQGIDQADNTAITTLNDATSNANNGTLTNFALSGVTSNWLAGSPVTTGSTIPSAPTASNQTFCAASTVNDLMPAPSATINWYNAATASTVLNPTDDLTTGTYYVTNVNAAGCESDRVAVTVTVSVFTVTITSQTNVTCFDGNDGSVSLSVSGGVGPYTILWDDGTAYEFTRNNLRAGTYRAWITDDAGCTDYMSGAGGTLVTITEPTVLTAPTVTSPVVYDQGDVAVPLTATSSGSGLLWYTTSTGGTGATTAPTPLTDTVGSTSYWVSSTSSASCESSSRSEIVVTVNAYTNPPTTAWTTQVYTGDDKDLTVLTVSGNSLKWYDAAIGGNLLPSTTLLVDETTYYASQTIDGVESTNRLAITVNRISDNTQLLLPASTVADLVATPSTGTVAQWFTTATGGTPLASTDVLSNGVYYVEQFTNLTSVEIIGSGFNAPSGVAVQADGKILVSDSNNHAIKRMDSDGTNIEIFTAGINSPSGIAVQSDGKIVFTDSDNGAKVKRMNSDGSNIETLASGFPINGGLTIQNDGKILFTTLFNVKRMNSNGSNIEDLGPVFTNAPGAAVQPDDKIVVADRGNFAVTRMNADGSNVETLNTGNVYPNGIAVQSDGKIVIVNALNTPNVINRMDSDGSNIEVLGQMNNPRGLAIESNGNILVADMGDNTIKRIIFTASASNRVPVTIDVTSLSTSTFDGNNFTIYPNPTKGLFTITTESKVKVEVHDISGRLVLLEDIMNTQTFSIENQAAGVYIVKVASESGVFKSIKLIKE